MLKIVCPICCGMDIHKSFVVACIASTNERGVTTYKSKRFSMFTGDLRRCAAWLAENNCKDVCMESTGKYWIPVYNILESTCKIVLAHPKYVGERRPTSVTLSGSLTSSNMTSLPEALSRQWIFASFGIWCVIAGNLPTLLPERKIGHKTALPSPTSNWTMCFPMYLGKLHPQSQHACLKSQLRK